MNYQVVIKKKALKYLSTVPPRDGKAIYKAIEEMEIDPFSGDVKKLQGGENEYRRRVGKYRLLFTIENSVLTVTVFDAGHRKNIYE